MICLKLEILNSDFMKDKIIFGLATIIVILIITVISINSYDSGYKVGILQNAVDLKTSAQVSCVKVNRTSQIEISNTFEWITGDLVYIKCNSSNYSFDTKSFSAKVDGTMQCNLTKSVKVCSYEEG